MEDYAKMYAVLCGAIDDVIDGLEALPGAAAGNYALGLPCKGSQKASPSGELAGRSPD